MRMLEGVVIAGAGPVGLTTAAALARRGVPVTVLEAGETLSAESRASTFHPSSLEVLQELGVVDTLLDEGVVVPAVQFRDRQKGMIAEFDYSVLRGETPYPFRLQFEQHKLTPLLLERLRAFPDAEVLFDHRAVSVEIASDAAVLTAVHEDEEVRFRAPLVVGADGAGSAVRKTAGIEFEGITYPERYLVVSTELDLREVLPDVANVTYVSDPNEWLAFIRTPDHWRATFPMRDEEDAAAAQEHEAIQRRMQGIAARDDGYPVVHTNIYRVHRRVAATFVRGRVVLVGDAAHVNNPLGGLGMNSGILDGFFAAGHLAAVLRDGAPLSLLDEFGKRHRHMAVDVVGATSNFNWLALGARNEAERAEKHAELARTARDPDAARDYLLDTSLLRVLRELRSTESVPAG